MKKRFSDEQIISILREAEAGVSARELCRKHAISDATFYTWRKKYGGMEVPEVKRLKSLEEENARLKKLLAEAMLDKEALQVAPWRKHCQEFRLLLYRFCAQYCGLGKAEVAANLSVDWANCCSGFFVLSSSPSPHFIQIIFPQPR